MNNLHATGPEQNYHTKTSPGKTLSHHYLSPLPMKSTTQVVFSSCFTFCFQGCVYNAFIACYPGSGLTFCFQFVCLQCSHWMVLDVLNHTDKNLQQTKAVKNKMGRIIIPQQKVYSKEHSSCSERPGGSRGYLVIFWGNWWIYLHVFVWRMKCVQREGGEMRMNDCHFVGCLSCVLNFHNKTKLKNKHNSTAVAWKGGKIIYTHNAQHKN